MSSDTYLNTINGPVNRYDIPLVTTETVGGKISKSFVFFSAVLVVMLVLLFMVTWNKTPVLVSYVPNNMITNIKIVDHKASKAYYNTILIMDEHNNPYFIQPTIEQKDGAVYYYYTFDHPLSVWQVYLMLDDSVYWWQDPYTTIEINLFNISYMKVVKENVKRQRVTKINIYPVPHKEGEKIFHKDALLAIKMTEDGDEYVPYNMI